MNAYDLLRARRTAFLASTVRAEGELPAMHVLAAAADSSEAEFAERRASLRPGDCIYANRRYYRWLCDFSSYEPRVEPVGPTLKLTDDEVRGGSAAGDALAYYAHWIADRRLAGSDIHIEVSGASATAFAFLAPAASSERALRSMLRLLAHVDFTCRGGALTLVRLWFRRLARHLPLINPTTGEPATRLANPSCIEAVNFDPSMPAAQRSERAHAALFARYRLLSTPLGSFVLRVCYAAADVPQPALARLRRFGGGTYRSLVPRGRPPPAEGWRQRASTAAVAVADAAAVEVVLFSFVGPWRTIDDALLNVVDRSGYERYVVAVEVLCRTHVPDEVFNFDSARVLRCWRADGSSDPQSTLICVEPALHYQYRWASQHRPFLECLLAVLALPLAPYVLLEVLLYANDDLSFFPALHLIEVADRVRKSVAAVRAARLCDEFGGGDALEPQPRRRMHT